MTYVWFTLIAVGNLSDYEYRDGISHNGITCPQIDASPKSFEISILEPLTISLSVVPGRVRPGREPVGTELPERTVSPTLFLRIKSNNRTLKEKNQHKLTLWRTS